ncbi:Hpt domain-containing protein [Vibrio sp.]|nr:Hpt domain-containing protein [Vibrio sp.]
MNNVIDEVVINNLIKEIGQEHIPVLLGIFTQELEGYIERTQQLTGLELNQYLADISHELKSSAASFGASRLESLVLLLDKKAKNGDSLTEPNTVMNFQQEVTLVLRELKTFTE